MIGAGAFGLSLGIALSQTGQKVVLWGRDAADVRNMQLSRISSHRLPGYKLPDSLRVTSRLDETQNSVALLAVPMASLQSVLSRSDFPVFSTLVACMKGIDPATGNTPSDIVSTLKPQTQAAVLTGPSFAADIASGLPTALVIAGRDWSAVECLQARLSTPTLRLYGSTDLKGAELGGALKNVVAIAAGITIGADLGQSARAAVIARGMAEMTRLATLLGAEPTTLSGLSGLGDLVLTASSDKSRNYRAGLLLGAGKPLPSGTIEGVATAMAAERIAVQHQIEAPIASAVSRLVQGDTSIKDTIAMLMSRPLRKE